MKKKLITALIITFASTPLVFACSYYFTTIAYESKDKVTSENSSIKDTVKMPAADGNTNTYKDSEDRNNNQKNSTSINTSVKDDIKPSVKNKEKVVYLTFDDGPDDRVTDEILDILKQYDIKATFFVIGNQIKGREKTLKRIVNENHSIGLHSWSHNYKFIYTNNDNFINEMKWTQNEVKRVTNKTPNIIRFPGGSLKHLDSEFLDRLHSLNFLVYDWNATTGDGMYPENPPEKLIANLTSQKFKPPKIFILMHSRKNNETTAEALPKIIDYYKSLGYQFKAIDEETPEFYFKIK